MKTAHYCMDNPEHQMFKGNADGARCPKCKGLVNIKEVSNEEYYELPTYQELRQKLNTINNNQKAINIEVDMNTNNLSAKLRAIAKHAEALANELEAIDAAKCPNCGGTLDITTLYSGDEVVDTSAYCRNCRD